MGTNFPQFILEANRTLQLGGHLYIAEVLSRFEDIKRFVVHMRQCGFESLKVNRLKDFFYVMIFQKEKDVKWMRQAEEFSLQLKPCIYKRR